MQQQSEPRPTPPMDKSINYMSWAVKDLVAETKKTREMLEERLSELISVLKTRGGQGQSTKNVQPRQVQEDLPF